MPSRHCMQSSVKPFYSITYLTGYVKDYFVSLHTDPAVVFFTSLVKAVVYEASEWLLCAKGVLGG